ncbi:MAG: hypothetical protein RI958_1950, partial [Actinomycetota bacterium]
DIISTDTAPSARMHHAAMTIAMRNFDRFGSAHPRVDTIAAGMHVTEGTARKALRDLERDGWLHIEPRDGRTNVYQALLPSTCVPAILEVANRRRNKKLRSNTLGVSHQLASALLASLGGPLEDPKVLSRIRGQISQILATASDIEHEATYVMNYVLDELPRTVTNPIGICHDRLAEYHRKYAKRRKKPTTVNVDPERAASVLTIIQQATAALTDPQRPGL